MHLKIRTKVLMGILFFFIEFLAIGVMSIYYFSSFKNSSQLIITNNYHSVQYAENMIQAIDDANSAVTSLFVNNLYPYDKNTLTASFDKFEENLTKEEENITEFGEKELVQSVRQKFNIYKSLLLEPKTDTIHEKVNYYSQKIQPLFNDIKVKIFTVSTLNMQAIVQKNDHLNDMVNRAYRNLIIILTLCFMFTFSFMFNFPSFIAKPVNEITEKLRQIGNKNFKTRIQISSNDEFKELAEAFNTMAEKLQGGFTASTIETEPETGEKATDQGEVLQNIQSLLASVRILLETLGEMSQDDALQKQAINLQEIEKELAKMVG